MIDYVAVIENESARFAHLARTAVADTPVPSCPGWSFADLTWHLLEVQYFWGGIVADLLESPDGISPLERPNDGALPGLLEEQAERLINELRNHQPEDKCWSWHDAGHNVGWVQRRQAHEALIHRVDAELGFGNGGPFALDPELAVDGVGEILQVMLHAGDIPGWASFTPDGATASIESDNGPSWSMRLGRFHGTSPASGTNYDDPALELVAGIDTPTAIVRGSAENLDLWLWGRGSLDALHVEGDLAVASRIRAAAVAGTQ